MARTTPAFHPPWASIFRGEFDLRIRFVSALLLSFAAASASTTAFADASALAFDSDGAWGWATKDDQKTANRTALDLCMKSSVKKDCKLDSTIAIAEANGGGMTGFGRSAKSMAEARKIAMEQCGHAECKITGEYKAPGFYALAKTKSSDGSNEAIHLTYGAIDSDDVDKEALKRCESKGGGACAIVWSGAIPGNHSVKKESPPVAKAAEPKSCRPNTASIRCQSQCVNGDCVISYENGCKMRVRVQSQYDPLSNSWKYPAPSC